TLNFFRRSLIRRRTIRFSLSDWLPGTCSSTESRPTTMRLQDCRMAGLQKGKFVRPLLPAILQSCHSAMLRDDLDPLVLEHLDHVADLDVVEFFEADAALEARLHLADVVLEAAERSDLAFVDDDVVAHEARLRVAGARDAALGDHAARDRAELRDL